METIKGAFAIKATPLELGDAEKRLGATRMMFEKRFSGPLDATSVVTMLGVMNKDLGSGGYVALERVEGSLGGHIGSFCLQHSSTMSRGKPEQTIVVVPDSGTNELVGLSGSMKIDVVNGEHSFTFEYSLNQ
jgi:hypothetical protein